MPLASSPDMRTFLILAFVSGLVLCIVIPTLTRCVVEGTLVDTPTGSRPVEQLAVGDRVWSRAPDGTVVPGTVVAVYPSHTFRWLRFALEDGSTLDVTRTHPLATASGWEQAGDVSQGRELLVRSGAVGVADVETVWSWRTVYDISVEPYENFFASGVLVHNKSRTAPQAQAIGDTRSVISALQTYASANCGLFPGDLTEMTRDDGTPIAIPGYPDGAPEFLGLDLARPSPYVKSGYERAYQAFHPPEDIASECAPTSVASFCYVSRPTEQLRPRGGSAMPVWLANWLGIERYRSFVATSDGAIYMDWEGRDLSCIDGKPPSYARYLE